MSTQTIGSVVPEWTIGDRLRKARETTNLDRQAFATDLGIARNTLTKYETGDRLPPRPLLIAWCVRTGVSMTWVMTGNAADPSPDGDGWRARRDSNPQPSDP
ncbi:MAG TPA: helix-turn-helix transcriptional regulator [Mycobacteriales bacterium]|nr:helix-turn-helix transcriptional regulator [Mycobacteriales bacterium]